MDGKSKKDIKIIFFIEIIFLLSCFGDTCALTG